MTAQPANLLGAADVTAPHPLDNYFDTWTREVTQADSLESYDPMPFSDFIEEAWKIVEPNTEYVHGWHIDAISDHLQAVTDGDIRRLVINIPPRHMKSLLISVLWPAWVWSYQPWARWIFASYAATLATRDSVKCRQIIRSPWYQAEFGRRFQLSGDQNLKNRFENNRTGYRIATSVGGVGTGEGGDIIVVDDPHKVGEGDSTLARERAVEWWRTEMSTRGNDPATVAHVIVAQRVHHKDVSGEMMDRGYDALVLPAEFEPKRKKWVTTTTFKDPRKKDGELLWPQRFNAESVKEIKTDLGAYATAGQLQQRPAPLEGGIFKRAWWKFYKRREFLTKGDPDEWLASWDMAFKGKADSDRVAAGVWARYGADIYLIDAIADTLDFVETVAAVRRFSSKWPQAKRKLIEDKANGPAVISFLRKEVQGLIPEGVTGDKLARAHAVSPLVEAGNVHLPHPTEAPWIEEYIEEMGAFPRSEHDDQVDQTTQALNRMAGKRRKPTTRTVHWG